MKVKKDYVTAEERIGKQKPGKYKKWTLAKKVASIKAKAKAYLEKQFV